MYDPCPLVHRRMSAARTAPAPNREDLMKHGPTERGRLVATALATLFALGLAGPAAAYQQAPMLDAKVQAGELPPVDERLPETPFVETMVEGVGKYGGTLRTTILANGDHY